MKKTDLEHGRLRPVCETSGFTQSGPNEAISKVESRVSAGGDAMSEELGRLPDFVEHIGKNRVSRSSLNSNQTEPVFSSEPLIAYRFDPKLARDEKIVVKTTLQVHKYDRQQEQMKRPSSDVFGREAAPRHLRVSSLRFLYLMIGSIGTWRNRNGLFPRLNHIPWMCVAIGWH